MSRIDARLERSLGALEAAFALLGEFARVHDLREQVVFDLKVILEELFTNQVRHARPGGESVGLSLALADGTIRIELVDDDVEPFDPTTLPEVDTSAPIEQRTPGGLGIHFVRTLSDSFDWTYDPDRRQSRITVTRQLER